VRRVDFQVDVDQTPNVGAFQTVGVLVLALCYETGSYFMLGATTVYIAGAAA
jgi:hypothetical protein